ncbi:UvrD-helicase domain-containing protein [Pseudosulfitobacter pseudonitzschiae]|uniref:UvrD-helicase domain-containing protein n=1 Tax=Pseudosulfitobacter pseudonitzschiae TaxID=1402135 RepID=UPI003B810409
MMKPTEEQAEITEEFATLKPGEYLKAIAFAGAGKTSTLKACAQKRKDRGVYLAFNRAIAEEAREKLGRTKCNAMTMHSLAYRAMQGIMESRTPVNAKTIMESGVMDGYHIPTVKGWGDYRVASAVSRTLSSFAASADANFNEGHAESAIIEALGDPDFMASEEKAQVIRDTLDRLSGPLHLIAQQYWVNSMESGRYSDDMYLKMLDINDDLRKRAFGRYKYLMVDEAQDINPVQRSILTKTGLPILAVGDPYQQIYSWRGAENALQQLPGKELFLTKSFRFGENIAAVARHILNSIPGGGPSQRLVGGGPGNVEDHKGPKGAVICRTNIGMLDEAINYLNKGYRVHVDNVQGLLTDALSAQALKDGRMSDVKSDELKQFDTWDEMEATAEEGSDPGLSKLVNLVRTNRIPDVQRLANHHSTTKDKVHLVVYTGHRSKGLEFPAVQLGDDWPDIMTMQARYKAAEMKSDKHVTLAKEAYNTLYVASTRAMVRCSGYNRILDPKPMYDDENSYDSETDRHYTPAAADRDYNPA